MVKKQSSKDLSKKLSKLREERKQRKELEEQQKEKLAQQERIETLRRIEDLQNDGLFRYELIHQLQILNLQLHEILKPTGIK